MDRPSLEPAEGGSRCPLSRLLHQPGARKSKMPPAHIAPRPSRAHLIIYNHHVGFCLQRFSSPREIMFITQQCLRFPCVLLGKGTRDDHAGV